MIDDIRAELQKMHGCYRGCYHYEQDGEKMHRVTAALEQVLDIIESQVKAGRGDAAIWDSMIVGVASALRIVARPQPRGRDGG